MKNSTSLKIAKDGLEPTKSSDDESDKQPIAIQVHFNRAVVQIGLAAFRLGNFEECNLILVDVC